MANPQFDSQTLTLIPGLPNDLSAIILSIIPYPFHSKLKQTCKSWAQFYTNSTPLILSLRTSFCKLSHLLCLFPEDPSLSSPYLFDPTHLAWAALSPMPVNPHVYALSNFAAVSIGRHVYVLGGSLFDTRSFPIDRPSASGMAARIDVVGRRWEPLSDMGTPRGSFAVAITAGNEIVVAGGGSRHAMFGAAGSRVGNVERYDVERDEWVSLPGLPGDRAGCVGFCVKGKKEEEEFWVMGGYSGSTTISGVLPVDEYCKDAVVMGVVNGEWRWREIGDMWGEFDRARLGKVVVVEEEEDGDHEKLGVMPEVFMLDENDDICRYNMALNCWSRETTLPTKSPDGSAFGFVALKGELHVISLMQGVDLSEIRRSRHRRRGTVLYMQIYNPKKRSWRSLVTRTPFNRSVDFKTAVMCVVRV